jgi:hypothetical protein
LRKSIVFLFSDTWVSPSRAGIVLNSAGYEEISIPPSGALSNRVRGIDLRNKSWPHGFSGTPVPHGKCSRDA